MTKSLIIVVALWTLVAGLAAWSSEKEGKKGAGEHSNIWMREKLESSKDILAGLATSDFKKINKQAKWMEGLSQLEEVAQANREGYSAQLQIFHFANRLPGRGVFRRGERNALVVDLQVEVEFVKASFDLDR